MTVVPQASVHTVGERMLMYTTVEGEEGKFTARPVKVGPPRGNLVKVLEGV